MVDPSALRDCRDLIDFPDRIAARLVERAAAEQWDLDRDLPWSELRLGELPAGVRRAMLSVYSQIQFGEALALRLAERALDQTGEGWARRFCAVQVVDEVRHVKFFSRVLGQLGEPAPIGPGMLEFAELLEGCESPAEIALGVQVVLEGFAHTVFLEGARRGRAAAAAAIRFPHTEIAARFLAALAAYVGKDESRHVAFGVHYMRGHVVEFSPVERSRLEAKVERWTQQLGRVAVDVSRATALLGIPGAELQQKVAAVQRRHLRRIGLHDLCVSTTP